MNGIHIVFALMLLASVGCARPTSHKEACKAELVDINLAGPDTITFVREASGESGFAFVTQNCSYMLPLSISSIPMDERIALNHQVLELIRTDPSHKGVGFFEAQCECEYDEVLNIVRASSITNVRISKISRADQIR